MPLEVTGSGIIRDASGETVAIISHPKTPGGAALQKRYSEWTVVIAAVNRLVKQ